MRLAIRSDAGHQIGSGHVMRCLTLAEEGILRGHEVAIHSHGIPNHLRRMASEVGATCHPVDHSAGSTGDGRAFASAHADVLLVDGYHFTEEFQSGLIAGLTGRDVPIVMIDDNHEIPLEIADLVVNPGAHALPHEYDDLRPTTIQMIGADHAIVRRSVRAAFRNRSDREAGASRILVSIGGTDPLGLSAPLVDELARLHDVEVRVTHGISDDPNPGLEAAISRSGEIVMGISGDVAPSLAWADFAVLGAGTALWEAAHVGLPVIAVTVAQNQVRTSAAAHEAGFAIVVDARSRRVSAVVEAVRRLHTDGGRRRTMRLRGKALVDGRGVERIWSGVERLAATTPVSTPAIGFRPPDETDRERLFGWRNDPTVSRHLFGSVPIPRPDHDRWFDEMGSDRNRHCWVVTVDHRPVGFMSISGLDSDDGTCAWGGYVASEADRGQGIGRAMLGHGIIRAFDLEDISAVTLKVFSENDPAVALYRSSGFRDLGITSHDGREVLVMRLDRPLHQTVGGRQDTDLRESEFPTADMTEAEADR